MNMRLEFYLPAMRMAQTEAMLSLLAQDCALAWHPPLPDDTGSPFQSKSHTENCILTDVFNFESGSDKYALIQSPQHGASRLIDAWLAARGNQPHTLNVHLHDRRYGPEPIACDFLFVYDALSHHAKRVDVDSATCVSDHHPVLLELALALEVSR
jgi:endonuclease/exonuclease/phosphatase family metal-dependent hydrolase